MALTLKHLSIWWLLANWCADLGRTEAVPPCVSVYHEFEEAAITNNPGNVHSLFSTYYWPAPPFLCGHPLPSPAPQWSHTVGLQWHWLLQWTLDVDILTSVPVDRTKYTKQDDSVCIEWCSWLCIPSDDSNYIPLPCQSVSYSFLNEMTMTVSCGCSMLCTYILMENVSN